MDELWKQQYKLLSELSLVHLKLLMVSSQGVKRECNDR